MRSVEDIIADGGASLERLIREAFKAGLERGRELARDELASRIADVLGPTQPTILGSIGSQAELESKGDGETKPERATPGTVKPEILRRIVTAVDGLTTEELILATGFKPNSVRGTLSTLQSDKTIVRIGHKWVSAERVLSDEHAAVTRINQGYPNL